MIVRAAANRDQLGRDADGNLFRRQRSDVEPHRRMHARKFFHRDAFFFQRAVNRKHFSLAADHPDVARRSAHGPAQHVHVVLVPARDDHHVRRGGGLDLLKRFLKAGVNFLRHRKSLAVGKRFAVVDDADGEARRIRRVRESDRNVATAENVEDRLRQDRLDKNFQRAAANQAVIVVGFVIQAEGHLARRFRLHHFLRRRPHFRFHASAADRPGNRAVLAHQHPRALIARDRAVGVDDGGQSPAPSGAPELDDFFK